MDQDTLTKLWSEELTDWFESVRNPNGDVEQFNLCAALAVLEFARKKYPFTRKDYFTPHDQVSGMGGPSIAKILKRYGETRAYLTEGGRTTRGARSSAEALAGRINKEAYQGASEIDRNPVVNNLQRWVVHKIQETYLDKQRLKVDINPRDPLHIVVKHILEAAVAINKAGPVAQHLVGAKLQLRFPTLEIPNFGVTTADSQLKRQGDFEIGQTVFHVTVAPADPLFQKCNNNYRSGLRVVVIVPNAKREAALQLAEIRNLQEAIDIYGLEDFLGQNLGEIGEFSEGLIAGNWLKLLEIYNQRVQAIESDTGLLIEIPKGLQS